MERASANMVPVWDILVRLFHWTLVAGFVVAYLSEGEPLWLHVWAGYVVGGLVLLRILWGFIGPQHARFSDFIFPAGRVIAHLGDELRFRARRYLGHSPAGGAMVLALLATLLLTTASGAILLAQKEGEGPFSSFIARHAGPVTVPNGDRPERDEGDDSAWEEIHEFAANVSLFLVIVHVGGVLLASLGHRENLVASMIHGRKRAT